MNTLGPRRTGSAPQPAERPDLARKAVLVGAVLAAAVVFFAAINALWGSGSQKPPTSVSTSPAMARGDNVEPLRSGSDSKDSKHSDGDSKDGDSKDGDSKDSDSDDGSDDSDSSSGKSDKKHKSSSSSSPSPSTRPSATSGPSSTGGSSTGSSVAAGAAKPSARVLPPNLPSFGPLPSASPSAERSASGGSGSAGSGSAGSSPTAGSAPGGPAGAAGPGRASNPLTCTIVVADQASLDRAMNAVGPSEVICVRGGAPRSSGVAPSGVPPLPPSGSSDAPPTSGTGAAPSVADGAPGAATRSAPPAAGSDTASQGSVGDAAASGPVGAGAPDQSNCTKEITDAASFGQVLNSAQPGDKICVKADDLGIRLEINKGGSDGSPIQVVGTGKTSTKGITIKASNVLVDGFTADQPQAPGIEITGNGVTVQNNTITHPSGGDGDGLRFFGNNINILHNSIGNTGGCGGCHADCMQTFTNGRPSSEHVRIEGNKCSEIANICLMAEGPGDVGDGGGGDGTSADWLLTNNSCDFGASQAYMIEAVQNVTITNNELSSKSADKAVGLDIGATGATVGGNILNGIPNEVGMDSTSKKGYKGPQPHGGP